MGTGVRGEFYMQDTLDLFQKVLKATAPAGVKSSKYLNDFLVTA